MLGLFLLSTYLSVCFAGARHDPPLLDGKTLRIQDDGRSLQGFEEVKGREENVVRFQTADNARRLLQLDLSQVTSRVHLAAAQNELEVVEVLLDQGAGLDARSDGGSTPLYYAAQEGHEDVVRVLIDAGADTEAYMFEDRSTPIIMAAHNGHTDTVVELISGGANANAKIRENFTALHYASRISGGSKMILALLDAGANIDAQTKEGYTPLQFGAYFGQERNMQTLLERGADITLTTKALLRADDMVCKCVDILDDLDPYIAGLCRIHQCSNKQDILRLLTRPQK